MQPVTYLVFVNGFLRCFCADVGSAVHRATVFRQQRKAVSIERLKARNTDGRVYVPIRGQSEQREAV